MNTSFTTFFFGLLLIVAFSFGSCQLFKKTSTITDNNTHTLEPVTAQNSQVDSTKKVYTPVTEVEPPNVAVAPDTLRWCDTLNQTTTTRLVICFERIGNEPVKADTVAVLTTNPTTIFQPTHLDSSIVRKSAYRVVVMLPFMSKNFIPSSGREIPGKSIKAIEFYEGVMMALDSLQKEGIRLFVDVYDTERDTATVRKLLETPILQEADLIIGPFTSSNLTLVAEFAKEQQKILVSPLNTRSHITTNNPYYLQMNPSFTVHSKHIMRQLEQLKQSRYNRNRQEEPNYLILALDNDSARVEQLQAEYAIYKNDLDAQMPTLLRNRTSISLENIRPFLDRSRMNIIIMPTYHEEAFVYNSLRELQKLVDKVERHKGYNIAVIGMNNWRYYSRINFEYYEYLNLHFTSEFFAPRTAYVDAFKRDYKAIYGIGSREFALKGFDIMLFCGRMLNRYGVSFQAHLGKQTLDYRHTKFNLQPIYEYIGSLDQPIDQQTRVIRQYENQYLNVLQFKDYDLTRANN